MTSLFSVFDTHLYLDSLPLNWAVLAFAPAMLLPSYWHSEHTARVNSNLLLHKIFTEIKRSLSPTILKHNITVFLRLFMSICYLNYLGLMPYIFPRSGHLPLAFSLALPLWVGHTLYRWIVQSDYMFAHLVPAGSPFGLLPFIVIIELLSSFIRPISLSVRLVANIVAGHLLITLLSSAVNTETRLIALAVILLGLCLLRGLETAVAFIQAYVFRVLSTIYLREVNTPGISTRMA